MVFDFSYSSNIGQYNETFERFGIYKESLFLESNSIILGNLKNFDEKIPIKYRLGNDDVELGFWYIGSEVFEEKNVKSKRNWQTINCDFMNPYKDVLENKKTLEWFSNRIQKLIDTLLDKSVYIQTVMLQDVVISEEFIAQLSSRYHIQFTPQFVRRVTKEIGFVVGSLVLLNKSCHLLSDLSVDLVVDPASPCRVLEYELEETALYSATVVKSKKNGVINLSGSVYGSAHSSPASRQNNFDRILQYVNFRNTEHTLINISGDQNTYNSVNTVAKFGVKSFLPELFKFSNTKEVLSRVNIALSHKLFYNCLVDNTNKLQSTFLGIAKDSIITFKDKVFRFVFSGEILGLKINLPLLKIRFSLDSNISNYKQNPKAIEYEFTDHLSLYNEE
jgi:hypothetical protein